MNVIVVLLLLLGGFLIMDAVSDKRINTAEREAKNTVKYVPMSILDEQLSGKSTRDEFDNMFYSSGPWGFRDDIGGITRASEKDEDDDALDLAFSEMQRNRTDLTYLSAERRRVEERIRAKFDKLAEERLRKKAGLLASDPMLETYASIPRNYKERREARAMRRAKRSQHKTD